ncbi:GntR family transcriptional regulator (plasmid) [Paroceanicella profunda]|uniref:GntR family transcriptional regulator n=1 Tax=Paroceanicella profunda TaxID=2579971 RepID=A0A5B8FJP5_9RHOB|nr:GntR family transcriptional regulator [Paroceanicella profunda]QDL94677.1 GntR family transcriptional regulator [Paroceanicella profunda]
MRKAIVRVADLRQQVYDNLKERITRGEFPMDHKFQEISLAEELGVSRTPVREALALLVRDRILVQAVRGFRFPEFGPEEIVEITEIRLRLEPYAVRLAVEVLSAEKRTALAGLIRGEIARHGEADTWVAAHRRVRAALFAPVRNKRLIEAIAHYEDTIHFMRVNTLQDARWRGLSVGGSAKLADAIEAGDAGAAEAAQATLLGLARDSFLAWSAENA